MPELFALIIIYSHSPLSKYIIYIMRNPARIHENQCPDWRAVFAILRRILPILLRDATLEGGAALRSLDSTFLEELRVHRLAPLLYHEVARKGWEKYLPPSFFEKLRHDYTLALRIAALQEQEALQVIQALVEVGLEIILLKGADLRLRLYEDAAVRPMTDLDLFMSPAHISQARVVLEGLGFTLQPQCSDPRPGFRERFRNELHYAPHPGGSLVIDLHWQLDNVAHFYRLPFQCLWPTAIPWNYQGQPVKVLSPEHAVIHLALHTYDEFNWAMQFIDLSFCLCYLSLDWPRFLAEVSRFHCQAPVRVILGKMSQLLPQAVPKWVLKKLSTYSPSWAERLVLQRLLGPFTKHFPTLFHHRHPRDLASYLTAVLWPQRDYLTAIYGKPDRTLFFRQFIKTLFSSAKE